MTDKRRKLTPEEMAEVIACADCDSVVTVDEDEPDVFTVRVRHDDSCLWYRAFVRSGADQIRLYTRDQP